MRAWVGRAPRRSGSPRALGASWQLGGYVLGGGALTLGVDVAIIVLLFPPFKSRAYLRFVLTVIYCHVFYFLFVIFLCLARPFLRPPR